MPKRMKYKLPGLVKHLASVLFLTLSFTSFAQDIPKDAAVIKAGEALFNTNCKSCHRVKQKWTGPALAGVYDRVPSIAWIKSWVRNSSKVIASGDKYANDLYAANNKSPMTAFTSFTDEQLMSIMAYVKSEADKPDVVASAAGSGANAA